MAIASTSFKPGKSGNPSGMPAYVRQRIMDVRKAARRWTKPAISTLGKALTDETCPWSSRITAASVLLDRGYGKPHQTVDINAVISAMDLSRLSPQELDAFEALVLRTAAGQVIQGAVIEAMPIDRGGPENDTEQEDSD